MQVDQLDLAPVANVAALALVKAHPEVVFTSGRRTVEDQARAMASNVVKNRRWIIETYTPTPECQRLQITVNKLVAGASQLDIAQALIGVMSLWGESERGRLSKHFSGEAFDVQPVTGSAGEAIKATIRGLPGLVKFLEKEGGLVRWHAQFA